MRKILLVAIAAILLASCASAPKMPPRNISSFSLFSTFSYEENITKAYYDPGTKTIIALVPGSHQIYFWREGKRINVIGGIGTGNSNFRALADITMGPDASLYALDSSAKNVKKFNAEGKLLSTWELKNTVQPIKIALGTEQNCYVWDGAASEIIAYNLLDGSELYRFGRFQLERVDHLYANRDYVVAFDKIGGNSNIFSSLGQQITQEAGQIVYDPYNNGISLSETGLISKMSAAYLPMSSQPGIMTIGREVLAIVMDSRQVRLLKVDYEQVP
jgi:hypothetical protein